MAPRLLRRLAAHEISLRVSLINARGLGAGWHAEQLRGRARLADMPMAVLFREECGNAINVFGVPARCYSVSKLWITYQFLDGSMDQYPNPRPHKELTSP